MLRPRTSEVPKRDPKRLGDEADDHGAVSCVCLAGTRSTAGSRPESLRLTTNNAPDQDVVTKVRKQLPLLSNKVRFCVG